MDTKVQLLSSDNELFEVETHVIHYSRVLAKLIEDIGTSTAIPLFNVNSKILTKVIEYYKYHVESQESSDGNQATTENIQQWRTEFYKVDYPTLTGLIEAANYLNIEGLYNLGCESLVGIIKNVKDARELRKLLRSS